MTPKPLSPLDRMKRDNSPTPIDRWNESYARWEEAQAERDEWTVRVRENPDGSWSAAA